MLGGIFAGSKNPVQCAPISSLEKYLADYEIGSAGEQDHSRHAADSQPRCDFGIDNCHVPS